MRLSTVSRGRRDNGEYFIQITAPDKVDCVKVSFKTKEDFQKWGLVFVESIKKDEELRRLQVLEPLQRQQEEQRRLDEMQEIETRKSQVISERRAFKTSAKILYLGKFLNYYRQQPWEPEKKQAAFDILANWQQKTIWHLAEVKGGVQAFTSERGIDFSIKRIITEEYMIKIKENKPVPVSNPRDIFPIHAIFSVTLVGLALTCPSIAAELPKEA